MEFVAHHRFHADGLERYENIPVGSVLELRDGAGIGIKGDILFYEGRGVATPFSQIGITHFARDDDGQGLMRGRLTYAIAHAPRKADGGYRFTESERDMLTSEYPHWLQSSDDYIIFGNDFYTAPVDELKALAARLGIRR